MRRSLKTSRKMSSILIGIDLFLAILTAIWIVISIVADMVSTSNVTGYDENTIRQLMANSGMRFILMFLTSLFWTIFIMCG